MEPVRLLQLTNRFKKYNDNGKLKYIPMEKDENGPDIENITMNDLKNDQLFMPKVCKKDFDKSIKNCKPSVNKEQLLEFEKWTKEFGQDGWLS